MRAIADGQLEATNAFSEEMYFCLGCLACQTSCPAGVNYAELFEHARAEAEQSGTLRSPKRNLIRALTLKWLFMDMARLRLAARVIRAYQRLGFQSFIRRSGVLNLLPKRLRELEAMTPQIQPRFSAELIAPVTPPAKQKRFRVAMLTGCAQDPIFSNVNRDTVEVLAHNDCEVITPAKQFCCGSLHAHNGEWELAQVLARRIIDQFPPDQFDAIITNAGGCGSHLKHFGKLLAEDPEYHERARLWDKKVKDVHEWLVEIGALRQIGGSVPMENSIKPVAVTYHESCHLCHGQKITSQPRELLRNIPGLKLVELPESSWCCGSAGVYNLTQPQMADELLQRKIKHIKSTGAQIVATANPGCLLQLINGAANEGLNIRVAHPITLLAEAYRRVG